MLNANVSFEVIEIIFHGSVNVQNANFYIYSVWNQPI